MSNGGEYTVDYLAKVPQMMSRIVTVCHTVYHGVTQCPQIHPRCNIRPNRCTTGDQGMLLFGILVYL